MQGSAHLAYCHFWPPTAVENEFRLHGVQKETMRILSVWGSWDNTSIFPFYLFVLVTQFFSTSWVLALLSCHSQLSAVLLRALRTHRSLPCSQSILPRLLLGNSAVGDRKGGVPVAHYAHTSQPLKIRRTKAVEPRQSRNSVSVPSPLCWALPWWLTSSNHFV